MNTAGLRTELQTQLLARSNLSTISAEVHRYPPGDRATVLPTIILTDDSTSSQGLALGGAESIRTVTLNGQAYATTTGGASDDDWDDAETNLTTLLEEMWDTLEADPTIGGLCDFAEVSSVNKTTSQDPDSGRTFFDAEFSITITQVE
jgi:hypothetical protein